MSNYSLVNPRFHGVAMFAQRKEYIQSAEEVLAMAWGDRGFPVDPVTIAKHFGIQILQTDLPENTSGALIKEPGKDPIIVVHFADSRKRKRFTCAHELGHYIHRISREESLEEYSVIDLRSTLSSMGIDPEEKFANNFAANLLMPVKEVLKLRGKGHGTIEMAAYFDVSEEAMRYRLQYVNYKYS